MSFDEGEYTPPAGSWLAKLDARVKALEAHTHQYQEYLLPHFTTTPIMGDDNA